CGWIDADDRGVASVVEALQDQLGDGSGAAAQIHDLAATGTDDPLDDPPIDFGEEWVPRERFKREALVAALFVSCHRPSRSQTCESRPHRVDPQASKIHPWAWLRAHAPSTMGI